LGDLVRRQQGTLTTDQADQSGAGAFTDTQDGKFGVEAGAFATASLASACQRAAVQGAEIKDEAAEQAQGEWSCLGLAEGP
jgi:hypothetical protein